MKEHFLKGFYLGLGFLSVFLLLGTVWAVGFHSANEVLPGTFSSGNFVFNGNVDLANVLSVGFYDSLSTITSETSGGALRFKARAGNYPDLVVATDGNLGVGTTTPQNKFEIVGGGSNRFLRVRDTSGDARILIDSLDVAGTDSAIDFYKGGIYKANIKWKEELGSSGGITMNVLGASDALVIENSTGNIGIGTANPDRKLHINGAMRIVSQATPPSSPVGGDIYVDSSGAFCFYTGSSWENLGVAGSCS